jgi:REP element-mobilizing transposase RayT
MVHCVWGIKNREVILSHERQVRLFEHIRQNALQKSIHINFIGGYYDHVHCLISLNSDQSIAKVIQLIKGESSAWANKNNLTGFRFEWAEDYFAGSVSESMVEKVREYIRNQEKHHQKMSFSEEYKTFQEKYGK